jgi:hypothetical protein
MNFGRVSLFAFGFSNLIELWALSGALPFGSRLTGDLFWVMTLVMPLKSEAGPCPGGHGCGHHDHDDSDVWFGVDDG